MVRIRFQNVNGLKGEIMAAYKMFDMMPEKEIDIMGMAETNLNSTD